MSFEPVYDLLLSASYNLVIEKETDSRRSYVRQVGSDQLGARIKYAFQKFDVSVDGAYRLTNENVDEFSIGGAFTWNI